MFGKGVYFADMCSKSANYCCASYEKPRGLALLAEVALGKMYECTAAEYIEKLPPGYQSCKGLGSTEPDPEKVETLENGCTGRIKFTIKTVSLMLVIQCQWAQAPNEKLEQRHYCTMSTLSMTRTR